MKTYLDKSSPCDARCSLHQKTLDVLRKEMEKTQDALWLIAARTGVPFHWLVKFNSEEIKAPSVSRVQYLYEQLSGRSLFRN